MTSKKFIKMHSVDFS